MSLFSAYSTLKQKLIKPLCAEIDGEILGTFFSGMIKMSFINRDIPIDNYNIFIEKNENNRICLHDFQIKIDENPFILHIIEVNETKEILNEEATYEKVSYEKCYDSYSSIKIPNILINQIVSVSVKFELPVTFISKNIIGLFFPLTYPGINNDEVLKCSNFSFSMNFPLFQLNKNSITSNPGGNIDLQASKYVINHLDSSLTSISISINLNDVIFSDDIIHASNAIATSCCKYGSLVFTPTKDKNLSEDHSGEEFIFIIDCSNSMNGNEIELAAECLIFFIKSLPENCFFNVVCFGSKYTPLFDKPVIYNDENSDKALKLAKSLQANFDETYLLEPLKYVFSKPLSVQNKLRRIFILTDGFVFDPDKVIDLIAKNSKTTMCNSIGIGYIANKNLIKGIGNVGNGFYDFVLSGDDMRSKVINQLSYCLNGLCKINISIKNNEDIEILPSLSSHKFSYGFPSMLFFKSSKNFEDHAQIFIEIEGNSEPIVIDMKSFLPNSNARQSIEYAFNNEKIKYFRNIDQTKKVRAQIIQLSKEYGIITPYTSFVGNINYISKEEEQKVISTINDENEKKRKIEEEQKRLDKKDEFLWKQEKAKALPNYDDERKRLASNKSIFSIKIKTLMGQKITLYVCSNYSTEDIKAMIEDKLGIPCYKQRIFYQCKQLEDRKKLYDYLILPYSQLKLLGGLPGGGISYPQRNFVSMKTNNLIAIVSQQKTNGCWSKIPKILKKNIKFNEIIRKIIECYNNNNIVGTITSLVYLVKYLKECYQMWSLIYKKGIQFLKKVNDHIDWEKMILYFSKDQREIEINNLIYLLDEEKQTAFVIGNKSNEKTVFIPKSIEYEEKEFIITKIKEGSFANSTIIQSIQFSYDSEVHTIERKAFSNSSIEKMTIPSSISDLQKEWCFGTPNLKDINIMPQNKYFIYFDDKFILAKSNQNQDEYDVIAFVRRDIQKVTIPNFITKIDSFAFSESLIEEIYIPDRIEQICEGAFYKCEKLI